MKLRTLLFWMHLTVGVAAMAAIFIMSLTGVLLTYERQMVHWYDTRHYQAAPPSPDTPHLSPFDLAAAVRAVEPDAVASSVTLHADPTLPAIVSLEGRRFFVNPYTGRVWGEAADGLRPFFRSVMDWHRSLGIGGERRSVGRAIASAGNLVTLFVILSGFYLWWPRKFTWEAVRNRAWLRRGLSGGARHFNWHHVIGIWLSIPLFIIVFGGVIFSYRWANTLLYRSFGETPPVRTGRSAGPRNSHNAAVERSQRAKKELDVPGHDERGSQGNNLVSNIYEDRDRMSQLWTAAQQQAQNWRTITAHLPTDLNAPLQFVIDRGTGGQPQRQSTLALDVETGMVVSWTPFSSLNPGRRVRRLLRFAHTGEVGGIVGQTVAGIVSAATCIMVWTGLTLVWRRFVGRSQT